MRTTLGLLVGLVVGCNGSSAEGDPLDALSNIDWPWTGIGESCGDHAPEIQNTALRRNRRGEEPGIRVRFDATDLDGDLTDNVVLLYTDLDGDGSGKGVHLSGSTRFGPSRRCEVTAFHFDELIPYSRLLSDDAAPQPNMSIVAQILFPDLHALDERNYTIAHAALSREFYFCMPAADGSPGRCEEEGTPVPPEIP